MTVPNPAQPGSIEHYAEKLRRHAHLWSNIELLAFEFVKIIAACDYLDPTESQRRIANVIAAAELVRTHLAERTQAPTGLDYTREQEPTDVPDLPAHVEGHPQGGRAGHPEIVAAMEGLAARLDDLTPAEVDAIRAIADGPHLDDQGFAERFLERQRQRRAEESNTEPARVTEATAALTGGAQ